MTDAPTPPGPVAPPTILLPTGCSGCGYNLLGLALSARCPECDTSVEDSLRARHLQFAKPQYRRELVAGISLALAGILLGFSLFIAQIVASFTGYTNPARGFIELAGFLASVLTAVGYWRYTTPDPRFALTEQANSARIVARASVAVAAACILTKAVIGFAVNPAALATGAASLLGLISLLASLGYLVSFIVQFIAIMFYTAWLARRIPNEIIAACAERYCWMLPVIAILGLPLLGAGPLIAIVKYWNLLNLMRRELLAMN